MTCKDCLHYEACIDTYNDVLRTTGCEGNFDYENYAKIGCENYAKIGCENFTSRKAETALKDRSEEE